MSTTTSQIEILPRGRITPSARAPTSIELLAVYAGILLYIWKWQYSHPLAWIPMLAFVLASHIAHRDTLKTLGLTLDEIRASAQVILPLFVMLAVPLVIYALVKHILVPSWPNLRAAVYFVGYGVWCVFQQYLAQSYFFIRLTNVIRNPHLSALLVGLMFGAAHIPNLILIVVTALGGFLFSEVFARYRNLWPLAFTQAVAGALVGALAPGRLIHNMRVGPGYFFYGLR